MPSATGRAAVFLDRDGTLIDDVHYIARPEQVVLRAGAASAVRRLNTAGVLAIVITNQSGIARGLLSEADYAAVRDRVDALLGAAGARIDASYHCAHHPDQTPPCACRKPGLALYDQAIREHAIDPLRSACIGDRLRDVLPALSLGGRGILVPIADTPKHEIEQARAELEVALSLESAVEGLLN